MEVKTLDHTGEGVRFVTVDQGAETLGAEAKTLKNPDWVTISWRGRVDAEHLFTFFTNNYPQSPEKNPIDASQFGIVIFGPDESRELESKDIHTLKTEVPEGANFIRLDHSNLGDFSKETAADFSVWSRIDLMDVPVEEAEPDRIGVWAAPTLLQSMSEPLAQFVSDTHIRAVSRPAALEGVSMLLQKFSLT